MNDAGIATDRRGQHSRFYRRALAFCAMLAMALAFRSDALTDWDSWDYAAQAVTRHSSDLLLGRWWFIAALRGAYLAGQFLFDLSPAQAFLPMQTLCALMMAGAVVAGMAWTYRLTRSEAAETLFAVMVVPAPVLGIYASAVMSESMTLLALSLAMWLWEVSRERERGAALAAAAGLCFGVAVDIREPVVLLLAWPAISCLIDRTKGRWRPLAAMLAAAAVTLGLGVWGAYAWYPWNPPGYFANLSRWTQWMAAERDHFGLSVLTNAGYLAAYVAGACPAGVIVAAAAGVAMAVKRGMGATPMPQEGATGETPVEHMGPTPMLRNTGRRLFWLAVSGGPLAASMLMNHDLPINPRHPLPVAWMLAASAAGALGMWVDAGASRYRRRLSGAVLAMLAVGGGAMALATSPLENYYFPYLQSQQRLHEAMQSLPDDAVVVAGPGTPVAAYLNRVGAKHFTIVGSGWEWPGDHLAEVLACHVGSGHQVFVNVDESDWKRSMRVDHEWEQLWAALNGYEVSRQAGPMSHVRLPKK